ncbi:MAG: hypothetical protein ACJAR6_001172 [Oleispira sp.]|jgi:hypothetical protein
MLTQKKFTIINWLKVEESKSQSRLQDSQLVVREKSKEALECVELADLIRL